jgi:hypothetical protein
VPSAASTLRSVDQHHHIDPESTMTLEAARAILEVRKEDPASAPSPFYSTEELAAFERRLVRLRHLQYVLRTLRG